MKIHDARFVARFFDFDDKNVKLKGWIVALGFVVDVLHEETCEKSCVFQTCVADFGSFTLLKILGRT